VARERIAKLRSEGFKANRRDEASERREIEVREERGRVLYV